MRGFTFFRPCRELAAFVEGIWATDLPDDVARELAFRVLPTASPILCFHHRAPTVSEMQATFSCRQRMTGVMTRALTLRPSGPMRSVMVRLRPEAAFRIVGAGMVDLIDTAVPLGDIFDATTSALLEERLNETSDSAARVAAVQAFLIQRLRPGEPDRMVSRAATWLRREPTLTIDHLASRLDISDRQLARHFHAVIGTTPKQFARIVRIENVMRHARRRTDRWSEIAYSCGFSDQAHMIHEFAAMVGSPPATFFRAAAVEDERGLSASLAVSNFLNTFIAPAVRETAGGASEPGAAA